MRGVTYGPFAPTLRRLGYEPGRADADFAAMAASGVNAVRTLQRAAALAARPRPRARAARDGRPAVGAARRVPRRPRPVAGDRGASASRAVARARGPSGAALLRDRQRDPARSSAGTGAGASSGSSSACPRRSSDEDPDALVTYVNYPSTEYLELPFLDFVSFNVYLEQPERLEAYLARLQNLAGDRPLVMAELGLDSGAQRRAAQAADRCAGSCAVAFEAGCAGAVRLRLDRRVAPRRRRRRGLGLRAHATATAPEAGARAVADAFAEAPFAAAPRLAARLGRRLHLQRRGDDRRVPAMALGALDYPDYEVDRRRRRLDRRHAPRSPPRFPACALHPHRERGLSQRAQHRARGRRRRDRRLPRRRRPPRPALAHATSRAPSTTASTPASAGRTSRRPATASSPTASPTRPGGPMHVLLSDTRGRAHPGLQHGLPARRRCEPIGGFDPQFRVAGDDVDVCWRLQERGWTLGFSPAAVVWHHRRDACARYLRQQLGYGRAEALLERKWPEKYNAPRPRSPGRARLRQRAPAGVLGGAAQSTTAPGATALFQSRARPRRRRHGRAAAADAGVVPRARRAGRRSPRSASLWTPLLLACRCSPSALAAHRCARAGARAGPGSTIAPPGGARAAPLRRCTALAHRPPAACAPERPLGARADAVAPATRAAAPAPRPRTAQCWSESGARRSGRAELERALRDAGRRSRARRPVRPLGPRGPRRRARRARVRLRAVEEHGAGRQLVRLRIWPMPRRRGRRSRRVPAARRARAAPARAAWRCRRRPLGFAAVAACAPAPLRDALAPRSAALLGSVAGRCAASRSAGACARRRDGPRCADLPMPRDVASLGQRADEPAARGRQATQRSALRRLVRARRDDRPSPWAFFKDFPRVAALPAPAPRLAGHVARSDRARRRSWRCWRRGRWRS